jgi:hypothetical protein
VPVTDHENLAAALAAALAHLTVIEKDQTANAGSYSYAYTDLGSIVKRTRPVLAEHGVTVIQSVHDHGQGLAVTTLLLHASGDDLKLGPLSFPHGKDAQATGSWITYMRRYALLAALGMATGEDDDGAAAQPREEPPAVPGYIRSVVHAREKLSDTEKASLREWMAEQDLPRTPSLLTQDQAEKVCDYILHGLPKDGA